jgi:subtilase family serine protease
MKPSTMIRINLRPLRDLGIVAACLLAAMTSSFAGVGDLKTLVGHVPKLPSGVVAKGPLPDTNKLRLAIGLSLRDEAGLDEFLAQLYDPASTNYQHYLTPEAFTGRFSPTAEDYDAVKEFARTNNLTVTATHDNRLLLDVAGSAADIQRAFHTSLLAYRHPTENRDFYAPSVEPSVETRLKISDISGLNNYQRPHPLLKIRQNATGQIANATGSGASGSYLGNDFRAAYLPGVTLQGTGQTVGLLQFDGYYASDISSYASLAGLTGVPLQNVLLDGFSGTPTTGANSGSIEVSLDIEMTMAMAPGLAKIIVFEAGPNGTPNDILSSMAANPQAKQLSSSWGWSGGPSTTTDSLFKELAAQGQSFFSAAGDSDAFTTGASSANGVDNPSLENTPSSSPYITTVGGTTLTTTGPGGSWSSEKVWNWGLDGGSYVGSSGGISSTYSIPSWQTGISMSANGGSASYRNIPDVALTGDNVFVAYGNGQTTTVGGTSCAAPLWAGLTALINQQAMALGRTNVGFLNPAIYALGKSASFSSTFHDTTTGNNTSSDSPNLFYATAGYDLCTGWGTPSGQALINALAGVPTGLAVQSGAGFTASGPIGGPFTQDTQTFWLTNGTSSSLAWSLVNTSSWLSVSATAGTLAPGTGFNLTASLNDEAYALTPGTYSASLVVAGSSGSQAIAFTLSLGQTALQNGGFETGSFSGWTLTGDAVIGTAVYNAVESTSSGYTIAHSGSYGAFLGDTKLASLSQSVLTVPGQYYLLSLWLDNPTNGTVQKFVVNWNTNAAVANPLFSLSNPPAFTWINLQFLVCATGTNTVLNFQAENDPAYFGLDDVSLTPVAVPEMSNVAKVGNNLQLSWLTTSGVVYQVQYKTSLLQANWINLNAPFVANSYSTNLVDPNPMNSSPQRFYRLSISP